MLPHTPTQSHTANLSALSPPGTPATPPSAYVLAQETPTRGCETEAHSDQDHHGSGLEDPLSSGSSQYGSGSSFNVQSMLEVLDDRDEEGQDGDDEMMLSDGEGDEEEGSDSGQPLVSRGRRRRHRFDEQQKKERSLIEVSLLRFESFQLLRKGI